MSRHDNPLSALGGAMSSTQRGPSRAQAVQPIGPDDYIRWGRAAGTPVVQATGLVGAVALTFPFQVLATITSLALLIGSPLWLLALATHAAVTALALQNRGADPWHTFRHPFQTGLWVAPAAAITVAGLIGLHPVLSFLAVAGLLGMHLTSGPKATPLPEPGLPITYADNADRAEWDEATVLACVGRWHEVCVATGLVEKETRASKVMTRRQAQLYVSDRDYKAHIDAQDKVAQLTGEADNTKYDFVSAEVEAVHVTRLGPRLHVRLMQGWTPDAFANQTGAIAHSYGVLKAKVEGGGPGYVDVQLVGDDPLRRSTGPLDVQQFSSQLPVTTPWLVGEDETGDAVAVDLAESAHMLIAGATRSGKSVCTYGLITHLLRMGDCVRLLVADPNDTTIAPFEDLVAWSTSSVDATEVTEMLEWVRREMDRRKPLLRRMQQDKFHPTDFGPSMPLIVVIIDEAANYLRHANGKPMRDKLLAVVSQGAKYGVRLVLITQRPDSTILDTSTRAQLSARICFRVEDRQTANMVFPDLNEPDELLTMPTGVGYIREVAGKARKFRGEYLADHWGAADVVPTRQRRIDITADGLEGQLDPEPPTSVPDPSAAVFHTWDRQHAAAAHPLALRKDLPVTPADYNNLLTELLSEPPASGITPSEPVPVEHLSDLVDSGELTQGTLDHLGDITVTELAQLSEADIGELPGHGEAKVKRIQSALKRRGLALRTEASA